jgi:hypothetical protein
LLAGTLAVLAVLLVLAVLVLALDALLAVEALFAFCPHPVIAVTAKVAAIASDKNFFFMFSSY